MLYCCFPHRISLRKLQQLHESSSTFSEPETAWNKFQTKFSKGGATSSSTFSRTSVSYMKNKWEKIYIYVSTSSQALFMLRWANIPAILITLCSWYHTLDFAAGDFWGILECLGPKIRRDMLMKNGAWFLAKTVTSSSGFLSAYPFQSTFWICTLYIYIYIYIISWYIHTFKII